MTSHCGVWLHRTCRADEPDPPQSELNLLLECKYYSSDRGVWLGREFLGLSAECGRNECVFVTNQIATRLQNCLRNTIESGAHQIPPGQNSDVDRLVGFAQRPFNSIQDPLIPLSLPILSHTGDRPVPAPN